MVDKWKSYVVSDFISLGIFEKACHFFPNRPAQEQKQAKGEAQNHDLEPDESQHCPRHVSKSIHLPGNESP